MMNQVIRELKSGMTLLKHLRNHALLVRSVLLEVAPFLRLGVQDGETRETDQSDRQLHVVLKLKTKQIIHHVAHRQTVLRVIRIVRQPVVKRH